MQLVQEHAFHLKKPQRFPQVKWFESESRTSYGEIGQRKVCTQSLILVPLQQTCSVGLWGGMLMDNWLRLCHYPYMYTLPSLGYSVACLYIHSHYIQALICLMCHHKSMRMEQLSVLEEGKSASSCVHEYKLLIYNSLCKGLHYVGALQNLKRNINWNK